MTKISPQKEIFAQHLAKHGNQAEAYRAAYPKSKAKPKTQVEKASRLASEGNVRARVNALREEIKNDAIADARERREFWTQIMRGTQTIVMDGQISTIPVDMKDRLKASELLGKADGDFIDRKILQNPDGTPLIPSDMTRESVLTRARRLYPDMSEAELMAKYFPDNGRVD